MRRWVLIVAALAALYLGARALLGALASDETRIRRLVEQMEQGYDHGDVGDCLGPIARDWRHEGHELTREDLRGALLQASFERDRETRQLTTAVDVEPDSLVITVDGDHATLSAVAAFKRLRAGAWQESWRARIEAELVDGEDGWQIVKSRHEDLAGTLLGR